MVTESTGKRFIGDSIANFAPGNLALIGSNLPHTYRNDDEYYLRSSTKRAQSIVIHFDEAALGKDFLCLPEAKELVDLLARAARGIDVEGRPNRVISEKMHEILELKGLQRWLKLVEILGTLAEIRNPRYISRNYIQGHNQKDTDRMSKVFDYVLKNYMNDIRIGEMAKLVNMADNSFSRYFSERTRQTFSRFLTGVRLNQASRLLIETRMSVVEICFECGFNNLSNFNRQFLKEYTISPLAYRKNYQSNRSFL